VKSADDYDLPVIKKKWN